MRQLCQRRARRHAIAPRDQTHRIEPKSRLEHARQARSAACPRSAPRRRARAPPTASAQIVEVVRQQHRRQRRHARRHVGIAEEHRDERPRRVGGRARQIAQQLHERRRQIHAAAGRRRPHEDRRRRWRRSAAADARTRSISVGGRSIRQLDRRDVRPALPQLRQERPARRGDPPVRPGSRAPTDTAPTPRAARAAAPDCDRP